MPFCPYCGEKIAEDMTVCPKCGEILFEEGTEWQQLQVQGKVDKAKHRANMYIVTATVLATVGIVVGCVLCASASLIGFFGIAFVCLGVGFNASADRHEHRAKVLKRLIKQSDYPEIT